MKKLQDIFKASDYEVNFDNRNNAAKSINQVLANSNIEIFLVKKGFVRTTEGGFKYTVSIRIVEHKLYNQFYVLNITPYEILKCLATFLLRKEVKELIQSEISTPCECRKCEGKGIIPDFLHYAKGVCFDCMGIGYKGRFEIETATKKLSHRKFIAQFSVSKEFSSCFPKDVIKIKPVRYIDHPTAIEFLGCNENFFYLYAPICGRNSWYEVPKQEWEEFKKKYSNFFGYPVDDLDL